MSKIVSILVEQFKRLEVAEIKCDDKGNVVTLAGKNKQGKSSILDAIEKALSGGKKQVRKPIKEGSKKTTVIIETTELIVKRVITPKTDRLEVVSKDSGEKLDSPQAVLDKLITTLTFDPLEFAMLGSTAEGRRKQGDTVKKLMNLDFAEEDEERKDLYDQRTLLNSRMKEAKTIFESCKAEKDVPTEEVSATGLVEELNKALEHNTKYESQKIKLMKMKSDYDDTKKKVEDLRAELQSKEAQLNTIELEGKELKGELKEMGRIDTEAIESKLDNIESINKKVRSNKEAQLAKAKMDDIEKEIDKVNTKIASIDSGKAEKLKNTDMPVDGLGFDEDGFLTFNGLPLEQSSSAEMLEISIGMGAKMNQDGLRLMLVRRGNDLDKDMFVQVCAIAKKYDVQLFIERIEGGGEYTVVIEDGKIKEDMVVEFPEVEEKPEPVKKEKKEEPVEQQDDLEDLF